MSDPFIFFRWGDFWLAASGWLAVAAVIGAIAVVGLWLARR